MLIEFRVLIIFYAAFVFAFALAYIIWRLCVTSDAANERLSVLLACLTAVYTVISTSVHADPYAEIPVLNWLLTEFVLSPSRARLKFQLIGVLLLVVGIVYAGVSTAFPVFRNIRLTVRRKGFHFLAAGVFYAGLQLDPLGLLFAAGCLQLGFLLIEACIAWNVEPVAAIALGLFSKFLKTSNLRRFGLSHTSLLIALSIPVWAEAAIHPDDFGLRLAAYAGVVSIGVGDSAASFVGTFCAERYAEKFEYWFEWKQWLGRRSELLVGKRTIVGSLSMLISQLITWWVIVILSTGAESGDNWLMPNDQLATNSEGKLILRNVFWPSLAATFGELFGGDFDNLAAAGAGYLAFYVVVPNYKV